MTAPEDTIRVTGGRGPSSVDVAAIQQAARRASVAGLKCASAARRAQAAATTLELSCFGSRQLARAGQGVGEHNRSQAGLFPSDPRRQWANPGPLIAMNMGLDATEIAARKRLAEQVRSVARALEAEASQCARIGDRLLRAAGLAEEGEGFLSWLLGKVATPLGAVAFAASQVLPEGPIENWLGSFGAQYSDDAISAVSTVLAPLGGTSSVAAGLSIVANGGCVSCSVSINPVAPDGSGSEWSTEYDGSIEHSLALIPDLTGERMLPGHTVAGVPPGTLAVQRVLRPDGSTSWVVLIPGTQSVGRGEHPFDGVTDLDLVGGRSDKVSQAVVMALADAGAKGEEPVVLIGHSLGGIAATSLAASPEFRERFTVGGVVSVGSPTATFEVPDGIPVLHVENDDELVSSLDGKDGDQNPSGPDRVTVTRSLGSSDPLDRAAVGSIGTAHSVATHLRTLEIARGEGHVAVVDVAARIESVMAGKGTETTFYQTRRLDGESIPLEPKQVPTPAPAPSLKPTHASKPISGRTTPDERWPQ